MFLWWSDPYTSLTIAWIVLTAALVFKAAWWGLRGGRFGRSGKILLVVWALVAAPWAFITVQIAHSVGDERRIPAPEATLALADGHAAQLSDLRGKVVLLDFWATWCVPCRASGPALADLAGRFGTDGLVVVGISADEDEAAWRGYLNRHAVRRLEARDSNGDIAERFQVNGRPTFVLVDRQGRLRWEQAGWTPYSYLLLRRRIGKLLHEAG